MPDLFTITTDALRLTWSRPAGTAPSAFPAETSASPFGLRVEALEAGIQPDVWTAREPLRLHEETRYTVFVQSRTDASVTLHHRDPTLLGGLQAADGGRVLHGVVSFGSQVGASRFVVRQAGRPVLAFTVEVAPTKLDYRHDYEALRADVQSVADDLALAYLRAAYQRGGQGAAQAETELGWVITLRAVLDDLDRALRFVAAHPVWTTRPAPALLPVEQVRRPDAAVRRAVRQGCGAGAWQRLADGLPVRSVVPARPSGYSLDTPAHRWLARSLRLIRQRLARVEGAEAGRSGQRNAAARGELAAMQAQLARLERLEPFVAAEGEAPLQPPSILRTAPGYREAYRACLHLRRALHVGGGSLDLGLRDVHVLYEVWCFLTVLRTTAAVLEADLPVRVLVAVEADGLRVRLRRGRQQRVSLRGAAGEAVLTYNPRFGGRRWLVPQQPDLLLVVRTPGQVRRYVLDAKYRLDASPGYRRRYGLPGPPPDALNTLHRYRDALRPAGEVAAAVALYPWRDAAGDYPRSRHHRAVQELGVGAIPLLPGQTSYLKAWLRRILTSD